MFLDGLFNFLNFIVSPSDQPQKFIAFVGVVLLIQVLIAVLDVKWGRGIAFTVLALLAAAFYIFYAVVILQVMRQSLDEELADPQSWASLGVVLGLFYWYLIELPILLGQGIAVVILAAVSRQRGWIIGAAVALTLTILAPFLLSEISHAIDASKDIFDPQSVYEGSVRLAQAQLVFTVVLFAFQLLYLAYGVRRIWRSRGLWRQSLAATSLPSAQS
ncbi:MAG TPA: hypothetical protein VH349_04350 [Ktedonobacterales bacterium]|jgi:hypothetical protein